MAQQHLRIGTRGSPLALWQAEHIAGKLRALGNEVELVVVQTQGDRVLDVPLAQIGGDGLFTKAIQDAVLEGRAEIAVHSLKDLPTPPVAGLTLAAVPPRGPTGDAFVSIRYSQLDDLPMGARIATGSQRRRAMILHRRPDLKICDLRGNIETRLRKLSEQELDGMILAEAGLTRLGMSHVINEIIDPTWMLPAVGQGALGLECRSDDEVARKLLSKLDDEVTRAAVTAERAFLLAMGGGCQVPLGAQGIVDAKRLRLRGVLLSADGVDCWSDEEVGAADDAVAVGNRLAARIRNLAAGGNCS